MTVDAAEGDRQMAQWRRFERTEGGTDEFWQIRQEGIRCFIRWGQAGSRPGGSTTVTMLDEDHAQRHVAKKIKERIGKGFVEVAGAPGPTGTPDALVVATIADAGDKPAHGLTRPEYLPVDGFPDVVCHAYVYPKSPGTGFYHYLVLRDEGRSAVGFNVRESSHRLDVVAAFLELVVPNRDLPFDGRSHHKLALPLPVGPFSHALLCSPALGRAAIAYPPIAPRVATAFPIYDCEIGDNDPEVLLDARIHGHGSLPYSDWARQSHPVVDLRFDIQARRHERDKTFKVYQPSRLQQLLHSLGDATPDSWLEIRSFRGDVKRVTRTDLAAATTEDLNRFILGIRSAS
jgi:predicted DNA-binding WGR domain protein